MPIMYGLCIGRSSVKPRNPVIKHLLVRKRSAVSRRDPERRWRVAIVDIQGVSDGGDILPQSEEKCVPSLRRYRFAMLLN
jgi:hypothetical protein